MRHRFSYTPSHVLQLRFFQIKNTVQGSPKLFEFLKAVVPDEIPFDEEGTRTQSKEDFLMDVFSGVKSSTMAIRMTYVFTPDSMGTNANEIYQAIRSESYKLAGPKK